MKPSTHAPLSPRMNYFMRLSDYLSHHPGNRSEKKVVPLFDGIVVIYRKMKKHFTGRIPEPDIEKFICLSDGIFDNGIAGPKRFRGMIHFL